jgi:hypothetical protein
MSYTINGQHTKIIFGLTENLPITAIIGLPFFVQAEGVIDLAEQRIVSKLLDTTWPISYKKPSLKPVSVIERAPLPSSQLHPPTSLARKVTFTAMGDSEDETMQQE